MKLLRFVPNLLTISRILLTVPVSYSLWHGQVLWALGLLLLAALTDLADGWLAREFQWRSHLGSWLDPIADKLLIETVLFTLTVRGDVPLWFCLTTVTRDLGLTLGIFGLVSAGITVRIQPYLSGKLATVFQNLALLTAMIQRINPLFGKILEPMLLVSTGLTVVSAFFYSRGFLAHARRRPAQ